MWNVVNITYGRYRTPRHEWILNFGLESDSVQKEGVERQANTVIETK